MEQMGDAVDDEIERRKCVAAQDQEFKRRGKELYGSGW